MLTKNFSCYPKSSGSLGKVGRIASRFSSAALHLGCGVSVAVGWVQGLLGDQQGRGLSEEMRAACRGWVAEMEKMER